mmetsp:Transcript_22638/g.57654  ORF Transcript_22638/g.57654 Transcript_22638/m.57654 type:complete len:246 (+) Transcript_22638:390-1127(+)
MRRWACYAKRGQLRLVSWAFAMVATHAAGHPRRTRTSSQALCATRPCSWRRLPSEAAAKSSLRAFSAHSCLHQQATIFQCGRKMTPSVRRLKPQPGVLSALSNLTWRCLTGGAAVAMLPTRRSGVMSNSSWPIPKLSSPSTWDSSRTKAVQHVKMGGALESNGYWWSKSCAPSCPRNSKAALSVYRLSLSAIPISNRIYKYKPKTEPKSEDRRRRVHASTLSVRHARESLLLQILLIRVSSVVLV